MLSLISLLSKATGKRLTENKKKNYEVSYRKKNASFIIADCSILWNKHNIGQKEITIKWGVMASNLWTL